MPRKFSTPVTQPAPHSWGITDWPAHVYPHSARKGRYLIQENRDALLLAGALVRVGRDLVILGQPFTVWLSSQAQRVAAYKAQGAASSLPLQSERSAAG